MVHEYHNDILDDKGDILLPGRHLEDTITEIHN